MRTKWAAFPGTLWAFGLTNGASIDWCPHAHRSCRIEPGLHGATQSVCLRRFKEVLPLDLFAELQQEVPQGSTDRELTWVGYGAEPQNVFEKAAGIVAAVLGLGYGDVSSVQYWAQSGMPKDNMHFDSVEQWHDCAAFPWVSTILYLDDVGPPTVLLSKSLSDSPFTDPDSGPANDTAYLSWPAANHLLEFSGDLVHGIHMYKSMKGSRADQLRKQSIVRFNFWKHPLEAVVGGPPMQVTHSPSRAFRLPIIVPLEYLPEDSFRKWVWTEKVNAYFGESVSFSVTYFVEGNRTSVHGCILARRTWIRMCDEANRDGRSRDGRTISGTDGRFLGGKNLKKTKC